MSKEEESEPNERRLSKSEQRKLKQITRNQELKDQRAQVHPVIEVPSSYQRIKSKGQKISFQPTPDNPHN